MDLNKLNFLVTLSECGSFTDAAERLFTTQSSVSKVIKALEDEVGIRLVDRSKRKIAITEQGKVVVQHAKSILASYNYMMRDISGYVSEHAGEVKIAVIPTMAHYNFPTFLAEFRKLYPTVTLTIEESESISALDKLDMMSCDLCFIQSEHLDRRKFRKIVISQDRLVAVLPKNHRLAERPQIALRELEKESFLQQSLSTPLINPILDICKKAGFNPSISYIGKHHENIVSMVEINMGVSLMMQRAAEFFKTEEVVIVPLEEEVVSEFSLVRKQKRDLVQAANLFWEYMQSSCIS